MKNRKREKSVEMTFNKPYRDQIRVEMEFREETTGLRQGLRTKRAKERTREENGQVRIWEANEQ